MTSNRFSHIKTFKDFENEKLKLHYQIRLSEKRLEIKKLEFREYLNPIRFFSSFFNELAKPVFDIGKSIVKYFIDRYKTKHAKNDNTEDTNTTL